MSRGSLSRVRRFGGDPKRDGECCAEKFHTLHERVPVHQQAAVHQEEEEETAAADDGANAGKGGRRQVIVAAADPSFTRELQASRHQFLLDQRGNKALHESTDKRLRH